MFSRQLPDRRTSPLDAWLTMPQQHARDGEGLGTPCIWAWGDGMGPLSLGVGDCKRQARDRLTLLVVAGLITRLGPVRSTSSALSLSVRF